MFTLMLIVTVFIVFMLTLTDIAIAYFTKPQKTLAELSKEAEDESNGVGG